MNEIKGLIKERRRRGESGPLDLTSQEVSTTVLERQIRKRRSTLQTSLILPGVEGEESAAGGLMAAMNQLAWEKDIDLTKGKQFSKQEYTIKEEEESSGQTRTSSPGDGTPLLKDSAKLEKSTANRKDTASPKKTSSGGDSGKTATPVGHRSSKVHPEEKTRPPQPPNKTQKKTENKPQSGTTKKLPPRPPSARGSSGASNDSKDSAFSESERGRRQNIAISGSRSSLNSASSLTSLLHAHAWDGKEPKKPDNSEF